MLEIFRKKLNHYVSEEDLFIHRFDQKHRRKSLSQKREITKYSQIIRLRDNILKTKAKTKTKLKIWSDF